MDHPPSAVEGAEAPKVVGFGQAGDLPAVPIILGVIGHREVPEENRETIRRQLRSLFERFRDVDPKTPLVVLTGLAEGADQLAAEVALECGIFVRAVLPFPHAVYRQSTSFDSERARERLDALLKHPHVESFVAPLPDGFAPINTSWSCVAVDRDDPKLRALRYACYANVGGYIVRRCHALIAIWDSREEDPNRPSGTAEHVRFRLVGQAPGHYPWADAEPLGFRGERGLVLSIRSPKVVEAPGASKPPVGELTILMPDQHHEPESLGWSKAPEGWNVLLDRPVSSWARFGARIRNSFGIKPSPGARAKGELTQFREICQSVRDFNGDVAADRVAGKVRRRLVQNAPGHDVTAFDPFERLWFRRLSQVREAAAEVSQELRVKLDRMHISLFLLIALSATAFHFYAHWFSIPPDLKPLHTKHQWAWLAVFSASILLAILMVAWDWWSRLDQRRLDARALGEALRVRRAWAKAGIRRSVADSYAGQLRGEFSWVRHALLHVCPPPKFWADQFARLDEIRQLGLLRDVRDEWIAGQGGQIAHFRKAHRMEHRRATFFRAFGFITALGGWFLAMSLLIPAGETQHATAGQPFQPQTLGRGEEVSAEHMGGPAYPPHEILIISSLLVIYGGLLIAFSERQGHEELARQYERMEVVFRNAEREFEARLSKRDIAGAQRVIEEIGHEAITEQAGWYMLRRARSLELHIG